MAKENKFTPIPEIRHERIRVALSLPPFVDQEKIGVDLKRTELLMNIGGIRYLKISSAHKGITKSEPTIVGVGPGGEALAGKAGYADPAEIFSSETLHLFDRLPINLPSTLNWASAATIINIDEIVDQIVKNKKWEKGTRDPAAWSHYLNETIKTTIAKTGRHQLLETAYKEEKLFAALIYATSVISFLAIALDNQRGPVAGLLSEVPWFLFINQFFYASEYLYLLSPETRHKVRPSLFFAWQIDRAIVLWALSKFSTLAKVTKKS